MLTFRIILLYYLCMFAAFFHNKPLYNYYSHLEVSIFAGPDDQIKNLLIILCIYYCFSKIIIIALVTCVHVHEINTDYDLTLKL